ncbi:hypothetical protein WKI71_14180 [Streptomyces sp. MS1.AVA.1]|uniref:Uncharacterized protein n=1 Tax=Streptomyces machairae TaxID=3134109 RepID=A0ABU8UKP3_9ACTN
MPYSPRSSRWSLHPPSPPPPPRPRTIDIYTGMLDGGGAPQCAPDCGQLFHQDGTCSKCPRGAGF